MASSEAIHIPKRHPGFDLWEAIGVVVSQGEKWQLGMNKATQTYAVGYKLDLGHGKSLAVVTAPIDRQGQSYQRLMTAFEDTRASVENWLRREGMFLEKANDSFTLDVSKLKSPPDVQSAGGSPAYPSPQGGRPSGSSGGAASPIPESAPPVKPAPAPADPATPVKPDEAPTDPAHVKADDPSGSDPSGHDSSGNGSNSSRTLFQLSPANEIMGSYTPARWRR